MKLNVTVSVVLVLLVASSAAIAQDTTDPIAKAVLAAPANMRDGATVIRWKPDFTYETLRKGTNKLVCFDRSGQPGQKAFAVECTTLGNLDREAQNQKFEAIPDKKASNAAFAAAEKDGTRVKPEFGSPWYHLSGTDPDHARTHLTIAMPGATGQSLGLPEDNKSGGIWVMNPGTTTAHLMIPGE